MSYHQANEPASAGFRLLAPDFSPGFTTKKHSSSAGFCRLLLAALATALCCTGCAGWREKLLSPGVTPSREERAAQAVREFEDRRDAAQLAAALDRWKQGDAARAEAMLAALVKRRPDFADARFRLAEILWSRGDATAEQHLQTLLASHPNRAEAHHALGLLLDATNRPTEARQHLAKAAELEPENEIFRATYDSLSAAASSTVYSVSSAN